MKIQILGTGCAKCTKLATLAEEAANRSGRDFTLEKVTDIGQITALGVMMTPAMIVDGKLKCSGVVPSIAQLVTMFQS